MHNLTNILPIFSFMKVIEKIFNKKSNFIKTNAVHRRRDLDAFGEFINF